MKPSVHISSQEKGPLIPSSSPFTLTPQQTGASLTKAFTYHRRKIAQSIFKKNLHLKKNGLAL